MKIKILHIFIGHFYFFFDEIFVSRFYLLCLLFLYKKSFYGNTEDFYKLRIVISYVTNTFLLCLHFNDKNVKVNVISFEKLKF